MRTGTKFPISLNRYLAPSERRNHEKVDFFFGLGFDLDCGRGYNLGFGSGGASCLCARRGERIFPGSLRGNYIWIVPWQER